MIWARFWIAHSIWARFWVAQGLPEQFFVEFPVPSLALVDARTRWVNVTKKDMASPKKVVRLIANTDHIRTKIEQSTSSTIVDEVSTKALPEMAGVAKLSTKALPSRTCLFWSLTAGNLLW